MLATPPEETRAEREARAAAYLAPYLSPYAPLLASYDERLFRLVQRCGDTLTDPSANRVRSLLASRVSNDLHAVWMLASNGYAIQAVTAAATLIENGFRLVYIASSPELAAAWLLGDVPPPDPAPRDGGPCMTCGRPPRRRRRPKPSWENTEHCVRAVHARYASDATPESSYHMYREMCKAKHSDPAFLQDAAERRILRDGQVMLRHEFGPLGSRIDAFTARRALYASIYVAGVVCFAIVSQLGAEDEVAGLVEDGLQLLDARPFQSFIETEAHG